MQAVIPYQQKQESASVILLLIVLLTLLRPVTPFITDALAHKWFAAQHEQLHRTGISHLDKDIVKANEPSDATTKKSNVWEQIFVFCESIIIYHIIAIFSIISFKELTSRQLFSFTMPALQPPDAFFKVCPDNTTPNVEVV